MKIGAMKLHRVVELADDLMAIRVGCLQQFAKLDPEMDTTDTSRHPMIQRANALKGDLVSVSQVIRLKDKWANWTRIDGVTISTVQGFLTSDLVKEVTKI